MKLVDKTEPKIVGQLKKKKAKYPKTLINVVVLTFVWKISQAHFVDKNRTENSRAHLFGKMPLVLGPHSGPI